METGVVIRLVQAVHWLQQAPTVTLVEAVYSDAEEEGAEVVVVLTTPLVAVTEEPQAVEAVVVQLLLVMEVDVLEVTVLEARCEYGPGDSKCNRFIWGGHTSHSRCSNVC